MHEIGFWLARRSNTTIVASVGSPLCPKPLSTVSFLGRTSCCAHAAATGCSQSLTGRRRRSVPVVSTLSAFPPADGQTTKGMRCGELILTNSKPVLAFHRVGTIFAKNLGKWRCTRLLSGSDGGATEAFLTTLASG